VKTVCKYVKKQINKNTEEIFGEELRRFRKGRKYVGAMIRISQILENRKEQNLPTYLLFREEKSYENSNVIRSGKY
jgi:hypothetical protein